MQAKYEDFLNEHPKCGKDLVENRPAFLIFNKLSVEENIVAMIDASNAGRPAIEAVVLSIEEFHDFNKSTEFDISEGQRRTVVGCMIKTVLARFGYLPVESETKRQKEISKAVPAKYFTSGTCYTFDESAPATMRIRKTIVPIPAK